MEGAQPTKGKSVERGLFCQNVKPAQIRVVAQFEVIMGHGKARYIMKTTSSAGIGDLPSCAGNKFTEIIAFDLPVIVQTPRGKLARFNFNPDRRETCGLNLLKRLFKEDEPIEIGLGHISGILK
jgi:hypothetical protein